MRKLLAMAFSSFLLVSCQMSQTSMQRGHQKISITPPDPIYVELSPVGVYKTGRFDTSAAEIVAYDAGNQALVFTNAHDNTLEFIDIKNPRRPKSIRKVSFKRIKGAGGVNSVAIHEGIIAAAVEHKNKQNIGFVVFLDTAGTILSHVRVGSLPDMVTFTPDGTCLLVANEGEPDNEYTVDPLGSVSIINLEKGVTDAAMIDVTTLTFEEAPMTGKVRITALSPDTTPVQDLEPEYIAIDQDSKYAYVVLQENNAVAKIDIKEASIVSVYGLGYKDHSKPENALDASSKDKKVRIGSWPVRGLYMPDAIATYTAGGRTFIVSANEGDGREYGDYTDETTVGNLELDKTVFPNASELKKNRNLGSLVVSSMDGDEDGDGDYDALYSFGARSFSIWDDELNLVYDSGDAFEQIMWRTIDPRYFNASNDKTRFDHRSSKKGPEPEGVTIGTIGDNTFAFILLERIGGVMVYNISNPYDPQFVQYVNNRNFKGRAKSGRAGDLGPESAVFIPKAASPNGQDLLAVANEVSGSVTVYNIHIVD